MRPCRDSNGCGGIREVLNGDYGKLLPPNQPELLCQSGFGFCRTGFSQRKLELRANDGGKFSWMQTLKD